MFHSLGKPIYFCDMIELNYKSFGEGDPVIILHGLFGMLDNWQSFGKKLAEKHLVYLIDQRNHGRSEHTEEFSYTHLAYDIDQFMNDEWIHSAHIMGHSMGGKTAMQLALSHPERIDKLIVVDMAPKQYNPHHTKVLDALQAVPINSIEKRKDAEHIIREHLEEEGVVQFLMKNLSRKKEGGFAWKMNLEILVSRYDQILQNVEGDIFEGEVLFVSGAKSGYVKEEDHGMIKERFPNAHFESLDAGHWVHAEKPIELLEVVSSFLSEG